MPFSSRRSRELSACAAALAFVAVLAIGVAYGARFVSLDLAVVRTLHAHAFSNLTAATLDASALGGTTVALPLTAIVATALLVRRHWHASLALILSVVATQAIVDLIKGMVERSRPPANAAQVEAAGYAFPSAHAATSVALYGLLALVAITHLQGAARRWACGALLGVIALIGVTRIYLGAHYPTDVLAGWLVGSVVALAMWRAAEALRRVVERPAVAV